MVTGIHPENCKSSKFKTEHLRGAVSTRKLSSEGVQIVECPLGSVLASLLKTLETRLHERVDFPSLPGKTFHPLWFLVETEINVFLWRSGFSLADKENFEFWLDIPRMIDKRLMSLRTGRGESPFSDPRWEPFSTAFPTGSSPKRNEEEISYLECLKEVFEDIAKEAYALSQVGSMLYEESSGLTRTRILLPHSPAKGISAKVEESRE